MSSRIYTRTGDKGETSLFTGQRVAKNNSFIEALGNVDEANATIGVVRACLPADAQLNKVNEQLEIIQHALFDVGAALATPRSCQSEQKIKKTRFDEESIAFIEQWIDEMEGALPTLHNFILPGGHLAGAMLHMARTTVRSAERFVISLYEQGDVAQAVLIYLNRLSDYLFVLSRFVNHHLKVAETIWQPHKIALNN